MKNMEKNSFPGNLRRKYIAGMLIISTIFSFLQPFSMTEALVIDGAVENTLSGDNSNFVNLSNSGGFGVNFSFSGMLDPGNTFLITATDGSGQTATGSLLSASG